MQTKTLQPLHGSGRVYTRALLLGLVGALLVSACGEVAEEDQPDARQDQPDAQTCESAVGAGTAGLIDNLEDGDALTIEQDGRRGSWYLFNDGSGAQRPNPPMPEAGGANASQFAMRTSGEGFDAFAGIGATMTSGCRYDASSYRGIGFTGKSNLATSAEIIVAVTTAATVSVELGGDCSADCFDHFATTVVLSPAFERVEIEWAALTQRGFGSPATFSKFEILAVEFSPVNPAEFDFTVDDVLFLQQ